jgi:hypothetical protein
MRRLRNLRPRCVLATVVLMVLALMAALAGPSASAAPQAAIAKYTTLQDVGRVLAPAASAGAVGAAPGTQAHYSDYGWFPDFPQCDITGYWGQATGQWLAHHCDPRIFGWELYVLYP